MTVGDIRVPSALDPTTNGGAGHGTEAPEHPAEAEGQRDLRASDQATADDNDGIGGMSALRGLLVYGSVLAFAGLYAYFMIVISTSRTGVKPTIDATLISAAAALSGVLGAAFALKIGVPPKASLLNRQLADHIRAATEPKAPLLLRTGARIRTALSLEPSDTKSKSWPLTFGVWAYALVASATLMVYLVNQNETPSSVKALAVTFAGYVLALLNLAYGVTRRTA